MKNTEDPKATETHQFLTVFNKATHDEDDSLENEHVTEIESHTVNGEQNDGKENELLTSNIEIIMENQKIGGLIAHAMNKLSSSRFYLQDNKN